MTASLPQPAIDAPPRPEAIDEGQIRFIDTYLPPLRAGSYSLNVTQTFRTSGALNGEDADENQTKTQKFVVTAPRFSILPHEVHSVFPPKNAQGVFGSVLPQITLAHRALPWERGIWEGDAGGETPWMALIVLRKGEVLTPSIGTQAGVTDTATGLSTISLSTLGDQPAGGLADTVICPAIDPEDDGDDILSAITDDPKIQIVEISGETFNAVVPRQAALRLLGSVREVNIGSKALGGALDADADIEDTPTLNTSRFYSVLTAHRLPRPPRSGGAPVRAEENVVHLVSLEGLTDYLADDGAGVPVEKTRVRMVSLAAWGFTALPETGQNFVQLMRGLAPEDGEALTLTMPVSAPPAPGDDAAAYAAGKIGAGYVPRAYRTRQGEQTFGWYRGPFVPQVPAPLPWKNGFVPLTSAELAIYDDARGMFDLSYATAFETGRLMALSSGSFMGALNRWQIAGFRMLTALVHAANREGFDLSALTAQQIEYLDDLKALTHAPVAVRRFMDTLRSGLYDTLSEGFSDPAVLAADMQADLQDARDAAQGVMTADMLHTALEQQSVRDRFIQWTMQNCRGILSFLGRLWLLEGVPYNTLVADSALLPRESFRAFYVDPNWQIALVQGALAAGISGSQDTALHAVLRSTFLSQARQAGLERRAALLGEEAALLSEGTGQEGTAPEAPTPVAMAGCLLRSAAVAGWPGLEIKAFQHQNDAGERSFRLPLARMTRLSPSVMLCLTVGAPDWIEIDEPHEGLHFGFQDADPGPAAPDGMVVELRYDGTGATGETGTVIPGIPPVAPPVDAGTGVVDVAAMAGAMAEALGTEDFGSGDFALQLIKVPERMVFRAASEGAAP